MEKQETAVEEKQAPPTVFWIKPNGTEIETNAEIATVAYCEKLGWERADDENAINTIDTMSGAELDQYVADNEIGTPDNWSKSTDDEKKMKVAYKRAWLNAYLEGNLTPIPE